MAFPATRLLLPFWMRGREEAPARRSADHLLGPLAEATFGLEHAHPEFSARTVITSGQCTALLILALSIAGGALATPSFAALVAVAILACWFVANAVFRAWLVWLGLGSFGGVAPVPADGDLPPYSILVPLHREANIVPRLVRALTDLDYPHDRLDIKIILEADDRETIAAVLAANLDARFHVIHVPAAQPRTKPKACNYALSQVRGEFTVIFDAEDRPEPDQLRKAVAAFRNSSEDTVCLQARLNFFNATECWLSNGLMAHSPQAK